MKHVIFDCDGTLIDTSTPKYKLFPGINELILELSPSCLLYVWTARGRASTLQILKELGVYSYFDSFSCSGEWGPKPQIGGLEALVGRAPRNSICVIGDSPQDMQGAKKFQVMGIGATWGHGTANYALEEFGADFLVSHPKECSKLVREILKGDDHV